MDLDAIALAEHFPDSGDVRADVADYYLEVQRFDRELGEILDALERAGELERTVVVVTGDHGMPFPRCKGNLYDCGSRVPLALRWPGVARAGHVTRAFVNLTDLAPTFLDAAGLPAPSVMTGKSLRDVVRAEVVSDRDHIVIGKERHVPSQEGSDSGGTPMRALRTRDYLYIRNYEPSRWPAGTPEYERAYLPGSWYGDVDNGPTKAYMIDARDRDANHRNLFELAFGKRPAEELYDLSTDPGQLVNVASNPAYAETKQELAKRLTKSLTERDDPRVTGEGARFDTYPYYGGTPLAPAYEPR
jgi:N-sulfoglucosamine sulfohydrolase